MVHANAFRYVALRPFGILLLAPLIVATSAAILLGLLGIFVVWLLIVGALVAAIVGSDIVQHSMRRLAPAPSLRQRAVGYR
jgi:hypothetical protein